MPRLKFFLMKNILFFVLIVSQFTAAQLSTKDFKTTNLESEGVIGNLLIQASRQQDLDSIIYFTSKALDLSKKKKDEGLKAHAFYSLGTTYFYKQELKKATYNINQCIAIAKKNNLTNFLREGYRMLGILAGEDNDFDSCIKYFKESLKYASDSQDIMSLKNNIAVIYINSNKKGLAYEILTEVIQYYNNYKGNNVNKDFLAIAYVNMSTIAPTIKERLDYINKAITLSKGTKDHDLYTSLILKKGELLLSNKEYKNAIPTLQYAFKESAKWDYNITAISSLIGLVESNYDIKSFTNAAKYMDTLLSSKFNTVITLSDTKKIDSLAHLVYFKVNEFEKSFFYSQKYLKYQDSIIHAKNENAYIEYGKKYQTDLKIQENKLLKKDMLIKELEIEKEKNIRYVFSLLALISLFIIFIIYSRNKIKTKNNLVLTEKNKTITDQNYLLENANATKQKLFTLISHDLINPFNTLVGYSQLLKDDYDTLKDEQKKAFVEIIHKSAISNHNLVKNLLNWSRAQQKGITVNYQKTNIFNLITSAIEPYQLMAKNKNQTINLPQNKNIEYYTDENLLKTCIGNLFSNAIKFTPKNGNLYIKINNDNTFFYISIQDTGIGMTKETQKNIFRLSESKSSSGTEKEKGSGFGLLVCKEFIDLLNGTIIIDSQINTGTEITLKIPIITK